MASPVKPFADEVITLMVDVGSIVDRHLMGRRGEGKPVAMYSRWWTVHTVKETDGKRLLVLRAKPSVDRAGKPRPLMCNDCGGLRLQQGNNGEWHCGECGSVEVVP